MTDLKNEELELILKGFREKVTKLKEQGCEETDINELMQSFE